MKIARLALPCVALALAFPAVAQDYTGAVTLGFGATSYDGDIKASNAPSLDGRIDFALGNGFSVGVAASRETLSRAGDRLFSTNEFEANVAYDLGNGAWVGLYTAGLGLQEEGSSFNTLSSTTYGIEGGYRFADIDLAGYVGPADDQNSYGLSAQYARSNYFVAASAVTTRANDLAIETLGVAGTYALNDTIGFFAGVDRTRLQGVNETQVGYGLGATYAFAGAGVPLIGSIELGGTELFGGEDFGTQSVKVGVTLPLGGAKNVAPLNSKASDIINPSKFVVGGYAVDAF